jgi:Protein of unknown function (DUF2726)
LLTKSERSFYDILCALVCDHLVFAKVRLADLVDANEEHPYWQANFNRVCSKHIDFVVCDTELKPLVAVELDGSSHQRPDRQQRDHQVDRILELARLPLLRVFTRKTYDPDLIRRLLLAKLE